MEFSFYRQLITRDDFINNLRERDMQRIGGTKEYESSILVNDKENKKQIKVDFFFKLESEESVDIKWAKYWGSYFGDSSTSTKTVETAFGIIVIDLEGTVYAISLGRGHSYASYTADMDFGFDVAEIIHDAGSVEIKSAKYFNKAKNKSLTQYNTNAFVTSEVGESHELLVSKIRLSKKYKDFLLYKYNGKMKFGTAVKLNVSSYKPTEILDIVHEIHYLLLNEEKVGSLPRVNFLKQNEDNAPHIANLNRELLQAIIDCNANVTLSYYIEEDGDIYNEPSNDDQVELVYKKRRKIDVYNIDSISRALVEAQCDDVSKVSIRLTTTMHKKIPLMKVLDFNTEYNNKNFCLFKGKWANFNDSYMEFIEREMRRVNEYVVYEEKYNLTEEILRKGKDIQEAKHETYDQVNYTEYLYNIYLENEFDYDLLDRKRLHPNFKNVEFADLYMKDSKSLMHVKIGDTPVLRYCIQQSLHSADILHIHRDILELNGIPNVKNISMLFITKISSIFNEDKKVDLTKIKSIYFKIEIIEWLTKIRTLNYVPRIIVAKDLREQ